MGRRVILELVEINSIFFRDFFFISFNQVKSKNIHTYYSWRHRLNYQKSIRRCAPDAPGICLNEYQGNYDEIKLI